VTVVAPGAHSGTTHGIAPAGTAVTTRPHPTAVFAVVLVFAVRRRSRVWTSGLVVAAAAVVLTFLTATRLPVSPIFGIGAHQIRFAWPVAWFSLAVIGGTLTLLARRAVVVPVGMALVLMALALPAHNPRAGVSHDAAAIPTVRDLVGQLDDVALAEPVFVDLSVLRFGEPYSTPVLLELQRQGTDFVVDGEVVGQVGDRRERKPDEPVGSTIRIVDGASADDPGDGWTRVAYVHGPDAARTAAVLVRDEP
jgi:hypothetical protein